MRCRVQIAHKGQVLYEGEHTIEVEGDAERAVNDAMAQARQVRPGPLWDVHIDIRPVDGPTRP